jgi:hypothetical protein
MAVGSTFVCSREYGKHLGEKKLGWKMRSKAGMVDTNTNDEYRAFSQTTNDITL